MAVLPKPPCLPVSAKQAYFSSHLLSTKHLPAAGVAQKGTKKDFF